MLDYNEEARKLFASLDGSKPSRFNNLDPIYRSEAGGFIYVGGDLVGWQKYLMMLKLLFHSGCQRLARFTEQRYYSGGQLHHQHRVFPQGQA